MSYFACRFALTDRIVSLTYYAFFSISASVQIMASANDATLTTPPNVPDVSEHHLVANRINVASAVSWSAVLAGAVTISILSLILLILGVGLGLSSVSPWVDRGVTATAIGLSTVVWLIVTQAIASGVGGYLAGRMRTRWLQVHRDEVYFRDTAHGFLSWAVATIAMAVLMTTVISSIVGGGVRAGASIVSGVAEATSTVGSTQNSASQSAIAAAGNRLQINILDTLFRSEPADGTTRAHAATIETPQERVVAQQSSTAINAELSQILVRSLRVEAISPADLSYLGRWVTQRTGLNQQDAEKRVAETFSALRKEASEAEFAARSAADLARKASAKAALWLFASLLIGAFVASFAAIYGGRERDR
jgi:hypothetical protein